MSAKTTLKQHEEVVEAGTRGFRLYHEILNESTAYVLLEINGVAFEAGSADPFPGKRGNFITIRLPIEWARELGLIGELI